jgi:hypothetical protein
MPGEKDYKIVAGPAHRASAAIAIQTAWRRFKIAKALKEKGLSLRPEESSLTGRATRDNHQATLDKEIAVLSLVDGQTKLSTKYLEIFHDMQSGKPIKWQLPKGDLGIARELIKPIKTQHFESLNFKTPHYSHHLLRALQENLINKDEFFTAQYLYDALLLINNHTIPENPKTLIKVYQLKATDSDEPYCPLKATGVTEHAKRTLARSIKQHKKHGKPLTYYVVNLPYHQSLAILYDLALRSKERMPVTHIVMWRQYILQQREKLITKHFRLDKDILNATQKADSIIEVYLKALYEINKPMVRSALVRFMREMEPDWEAFLLASNYEYAYEAFQDIKMERESVSLLTSVSVTKSHIPELTHSPSFSFDDPKSPIVALVICPTVTFNCVLDAIYGQNAIHVVPQVGGRAERGQTMRMVRAWHDEPAARYAFQPDYQSKTDVAVSSLYPSASLLEAPSRPVEVCIEGLGTPPLTHGQKTYPAIRTLHDLYHAMIASFNTPIIRRMENLHDEKGGIAVSHSGMSKALEPLVDLEIVLPKLVLKSIVDDEPLETREQIELRTLMYLFEQGHFEFDAIGSEKEDDRYLLLYDMLTFPEEWQPLLYDRRPDELFNQHSFSLLRTILKKSGSSLENDMIGFEAALNKNNFLLADNILQRLRYKDKDLVARLRLKQFLSMALAYLQMKAFLATHPRLGLMGYLVSLALNSIEEGDIKLLEKMNQLGFENFFCWTRNSGVFFHPTLRETPIFNKERLTYLAPRYDYKHNPYKKSPFRLSDKNPSVIRDILLELTELLSEKKTMITELLSEFDKFIREIKDTSLRLLYISIYRACAPIDFPDELLAGPNSPSSPEFRQLFFKTIFSSASTEQLEKVKIVIMDFQVKQTFREIEAKESMLNSRLFMAKMSNISSQLKCDNGIILLYNNPITHLNLSLLKTHLKNQIRTIHDIRTLSNQVAHSIQTRFKTHRTALEKKPLSKTISQFMKTCLTLFPPLTQEELGDKIKPQMAYYFFINAFYIAYSRLVSPHCLSDIQQHCLHALSALLDSCDDPTLKIDLIEQIRKDCCQNPNHFLTHQTKKTSFSFLSRDSPAPEKLMEKLDKAAMALSPSPRKGGPAPSGDG